MTTTVDFDIARLDTLLEPYNRCDRPGIAVGVAHKGTAIYRRGFGLASAELPVTLSPTIRMRIGSTSKHFTCLCIMLLAEAGKLSPDDSVRKYIPELKGWADAVTLAGLMSHTSGTRCSLDVLSMTSNIMGSGKALPHDEQFALLVNLDSVNFPAGAGWNYSNGGYVLLTSVIERVSGMSYAEFLKTRVLLPVGMVDTMARPIDTDCQPNSAALHTPNPAGGFNRAVFGPEIGGEGNIVSTVNDMLLWLRHMQAPHVGSAATWARMRTPIQLIGGGNSGYGFGLMIDKYRGVDRVCHSGGVVGGNSQMLKITAHDLDVIVMANSSGINSIAVADQIVDTLVTGLDGSGESVPGPFPTGTFHSASSGRYLKLVEKDGGPAIEITPMQMPLKRHEDGTLDLMGMIKFRARGLGVEVEQSGSVEYLAPIAPFEPDNGPVIGNWRSDEIEATMLINGTDTLKLEMKGKHGGGDYALAQVGANLWEAIHPQLGGGAEVELDGDGLLFSTSRSRRMRFVRV